MKRKIIVLITILTVLTSCKTSKNIGEAKNSIAGTWHLNFISGSRISFDGLYATNIPNITFDVDESRFSGSNSCNRFTGSFTKDGNKISFKDDKTAVTMMACDGSGDKVFMSTLPKIDNYTITDQGNTLNFLMGDVVMMRFARKISQ